MSYDAYEANQANVNKKNYDIEINTIDYMIVKLTTDVNRIQTELPAIAQKNDEAADELEEKIEDFDDRRADLAERMVDVKERFETYYEYATKYENYADLLNQSASQDFANGHLQKIAPKLIKSTKKLDRSLEKAKHKLDKLQERYQKLVSFYNRYKIKSSSHFEPKRRTGDAKDKYQRINISLPPNLKGKWAAKAEKFGVSLSEVLRYAMDELEENLPDAEEIQEELREAEEEIKEAFKEIENLGLKKKIKINFERNKDEFANEGEVFGGHDDDFAHFSQDKRKKGRESLKKWARGIIMMNDSIPIADFAEALEISPIQAKKLVYELSAMGIKLKLKKDIYYFDCPHEEIIEKLYQVIDETDIF